MPGKQGIIIAMAPSALFVRTTSEFNPDNAHWFYWQTLLGLMSPYDALLCAPRDEKMVAGLLHEAGRT